MEIAYFVVVVVIMVGLLLLLAWPLAKSGEREAQKGRTVENAERVERRRNFQPQVYPVLESAPRPACGNAPGIVPQLALTDVLVSDLSALTTWQVTLDGETIHDGLTSVLRARNGAPAKRLADIEAIAKRCPHQEWLVRLIAPLQSLVYQRHIDGSWNLVAVGKGMF